MGPVLLAITSALVLPPVVFLVIGALRTGGLAGAGGHWSFEEIRTILSSSQSLHALATTVELGAVVAVASVAIGFLLAYCVAKTDIGCKSFFENALSAPILISPLFFTLAAIAFMGRPGYASPVFRAIGLGEGPNIYSFLGIASIMTLYLSSYSFLYLAAPVRAIPKDMEEAAHMSGASAFRVFFDVGGRIIWPSIVANIVIVFALAVETFAVPTLLGLGKVNTIASDLYASLNTEPSNPNLSAAYGLLLLVVTSIGIATYLWVGRFANRYVTVTGKPQGTYVFEGKGVRRVSTTFAALYVAVTVVLPLAALAIASFQSYIHPQLNGLSLVNYRNVFNSQDLTYLRNSAVLMVLAAVIICALGLLISYSTTMLNFRGRKFLEYLGTAAVAVPGLAFGVGMLWEFVHISAIYGTIWILLIACVTRFLPQGVRIIGAGLSQVGLELEEAAVMQGATSMRRLRTIVVPLAERAVLSAAVVSMIFVLNELPATILLYSPRSETVSVAIWNALSQVGPDQASAFAVLQAVVSLLLIFVLGLLVQKNGKGRLNVVASTNLGSLDA